MTSDREPMLTTFASHCARIFQKGAWDELQQLADLRDRLAQSSLKNKAPACPPSLPLYQIPTALPSIPERLRYLWHEGPAHPDWLDAIRWIPYYYAPWDLEPFSWSLQTLSDQDITPVLYFLLRQPMGWIRNGEPDIYARYLEHILPEIRQLAAEETEARRSVIDGILLEKLDIGLALFGSGNLKALTHERGKLLQGVLRRSYPELSLEFTHSVQAQKRRRLGIIIRYFKPFIDNWMLAGFLSGIPRDQYDITLFSIQDIEGRIDPGSDEIRKFRTQFMTLADHYVPLDHLSLQETVETLRTENLDILLFGNTMHVSTSKAHLLHAYRVAPIQIVTTITTCSTGLDSVDYYITSACTEPPDAAAHYNEKLFFLSEGFYALAFDPLPERARSPEIIKKSANLLADIPSDIPIVVSGAGWPKITPETLDVWMEILKKSENGHLVLYPNSPSWRSGWFAKAQHQQIRARLKAFSIAPERCHIVEPHNIDEILHLMTRASLYLDAFPYSGNMSLREPLWMGCPVITRVTPHQRGMQASAVLKSIGCHELIASDNKAYIHKALSLLSTPRELARLRLHIQEAMIDAPFYDTYSIGHSFSSALEKILSLSV